MNQNHNKKSCLFVILGTIILSLISTGCAYQQKRLKPKHFSGFLSDTSYQNLKKVSGQETYRWVSPKLSGKPYSNIIIDPINLSQDNDSLASKKFAKQLQNSLEDRIWKNMTQAGLKVTYRPGPETLVVRTYISGVETKTKGLTPREFLPLSALLASIQAALGYRPSIAFMYLELEITDSRTGESLAAFVSKGNAKQLNNKNLSISDMLKIVSTWIDKGLFEIEELNKVPLEASIPHPAQDTVSGLI